MMSTAVANSTPPRLLSSRAQTRSPGITPATKITWPSSRANILPPAAGLSMRSSTRSPGPGTATPLPAPAIARALAAAALCRRPCLRQASAGMRSRNGRRSSSACDPRSASRASPAAARAAWIKTGIECCQVGQDPLASLAASTLGAGPQPIERPHDLVEHIVGQPERRTSLGRGRDRTKRRQPANRPDDMGRQPFTPPSGACSSVGAAHTDCPPPLVEGVEHVVFAELDAQRTPARAFRAVPLEGTVDPVAGNFERNPLLGPASHQFEGGPTMRMRCPSFFRVRCASMARRYSSGVTARSLAADDTVGVGAVTHEQRAIAVDAAGDARRGCGHGRSRRSRRSRPRPVAATACARPRIVPRAGAAPTCQCARGWHRAQPPESTGRPIPPRAMSRAR